MRTLIPLARQQNLERPRLVAHQANGCEEPSELNDWLMWRGCAQVEHRMYPRS
jgi:hypothetical protein